MPRRVALYWEIGNAVVKVVSSLLYLGALIAAYYGAL